jgi:hypothetical protein
MAEIEVTNATRDRAALAADKSAGDAAMAKLIEEHHKSQQLERDEAALARMQSDPHHLDRALVSEAARNQEAMLAAKIADAKAKATELHGVDRITHALTTDATSDPLFDSTINGELPMHALRSQVEEFRSLGLSDREITAALNGAKQSKTAIGDAEWLRGALLADEAWVQKWTAGNKVARGQLMLLDIIRNATPID